MRILIVEDNLDLQANIAEYLENDFDLDFAYSGPQGLELALGDEYDVIVLDLMLPGCDGLEVCATYRNEAEVQAPILMLTARDTLDDKEAGFTVGADDYLVKPFSLRELKMRLEALGRRPKVRAKHDLSFAGISLNQEGLFLIEENRTVSIVEKERTIMKLLLNAAPEIVSTENISYALWKDEPPESGALRTHIYNLRRALNDIGKDGLLKTIRGKGYALQAEK
ncbi:response regulator transcription factor [Kordiimonas laminariae]|uniref:response regulator transcription factor n=1 Tax=Kordiimonas laminariae TaxID=2917717 RepID=UPI001FF5C36D|nr:response regulator transcription factor [Kordiimonas laminariae]MCK0068992.1 response regulator transcription factor [Kordiimonas laminariae]